VGNGSELYMTTIANRHAPQENLNADQDISNILQAANIAYARVDANCIIRHVDGDVAGILGLNSNDNLIGSAVTDMFGDYKLEDPDSGTVFTAAEVEALVVESLAASEAHRTSVHMTTLDGRRVRVNSWYNGLEGCTLVIRDITVSSRYRNLFEIAMTAADAGFWSMDFKSGKFTYSASVTRRLSSRGDNS